MLFKATQFVMWFGLVILFHEADRTQPIGAAAVVAGLIIIPLTILIIECHLLFRRLLRRWRAH